MKLAEDDLRLLVAAPLVLFMVVIGVSLWLVDVFSRQAEFAGFLAAELVAFSLLLYLERTRSWRDVSKGWLLAGCVSLVVFLSIATL